MGFTMLKRLLVAFPALETLFMTFASRIRALWKRYLNIQQSRRVVGDHLGDPYTIKGIF